MDGYERRPDSIYSTPLSGSRPYRPPELALALPTPIRCRKDSRHYGRFARCSSTVESSLTERQEWQIVQS